MVETTRATVYLLDTLKDQFFTRSSEIVAGDLCAITEMLARLRHLAPLKYSLQMSGQVAAANALNKRLKKGKSQSEMNPLDNLHKWAEYAGAYTPVLQIQAQSKLHETTISLITHAIGAANGIAVKRGAPQGRRRRVPKGSRRALRGEQTADPTRS